MHERRFALADVPRGAPNDNGFSIALTNDPAYWQAEAVRT